MIVNTKLQTQQRKFNYLNITNFEVSSMYLMVAEIKALTGNSYLYYIKIKKAKKYLNVYFCKLALLAAFPAYSANSTLSNIFRSCKYRSLIRNLRLCNFASCP